MTLDEARVVANIMATADNGCHVCVSDLLERLEKAFPQFVFEVTEEELREVPNWYSPEEHGTIEQFDEEYGLRHAGYAVSVTLKEESLASV